MRAGPGFECQLFRASRPGECEPGRGKVRRVGIPVTPGLSGGSFSCASVPATSLPRVATSGVGWGASLTSGVLAPFSSYRISLPDKRYISS